MATAILSRHERPRQPRRTTGKGWALVLAIAVQLAFLAVLVFSVQWQSRKPEPVVAELYAPPIKPPVVEPPKPPPAPEPRPAPPEPQPAPKPQPVVEQPDAREAEIALKARQEAERKQREEAERRALEERRQKEEIERKQKAEAERKQKAEAERRQKEEAERKAREAKEAEERRKLEEKRLAEAKERQQREMAAMRAQAEREAQLRAQAERELQARADARAAEQSARARSQADWIRRIQAKVKGNVIVPSELTGNPEAIFDVVQLPTGEIIEATLRKSSGNRAYDEAVHRAILKSSPLPRPDRVDLFQRTLELKFRPQD